MKHAIAALQAQGKAVSVQALKRQLGFGSIRDIVRLRRQLMPQQAAVPAAGEPLTAAVSVMRTRTPEGTLEGGPEGNRIGGKIGIHVFFPKRLYL
jgi:hypothetical protein